MVVVVVVVVVVAVVVVVVVEYSSTRNVCPQPGANWQGAQHVGLTPGVGTTSPWPLCLTHEAHKSSDRQPRSELSRTAPS